jgi:hypothetical protein
MQEEAEFFFPCAPTANQLCQAPRLPRQAGTWCRRGRARVYDRGTLLINLLFSMSVSLLPFSSALIGEHENRQLTGIVHAPNTFLVGLSLTWLLGKEVLPVFSSAEAPRRFLASLALSDRWHVRVFSTGELVSLLFKFSKSVAWVLPNSRWGVYWPKMR